MANGLFANLVARVLSAFNPNKESSNALDRHCQAMRLALDDGDLSRAAEVEKSLAPEYLTRLEMLVLRGRLAWAQGREAEAFTLFESATEQPSPSADAHFWRAAILMHQGLEAQALEQAQSALRLEPGNAEMLALIGTVRYHKNDIPAACMAFESALDVDPGNINALRSLAAINFRAHDWGKAEHHYRRLFALLPESVFVQCGFAASLLAIGREDEAWPLYQRAVNLSEDASDAHRDYAVALFNYGRLEEARVQIEVALSKRADDPMLHVARANCDLIANGSSASAWSEYEWRLKLFPAHFGERTKRWVANEVPGRRLLIYAEQGIGDVLLFARYIRDLSNSGEKVVLQIPPTLGRLMRHSASRFDWGIVEWIENDRRVEPSEVDYDCELPLLSLIHQGGLDVAKTTRPYLCASEELVQHWARKLGVGESDRLRVGIVWAGNPKRIEDNLRSILPEQLAPLQGVKNTQFVSLQMDARPEYKSTALPFPIIDPTSEIRDFADTAAIMSNLDLVLSIDTAAAHLAGALGIPSWVLLSKIPDWRWKMCDTDQPWYGTHRSFVVDRQREWPTLLKDLVQQLERESRQTLLQHRLLR